MKIIYYYQTFVGLEKLKKQYDTTDLVISSIHFGEGKIYLNDNEPTDEKFNTLWKETEEIGVDSSVRISCMMGGAGGAFTKLFSDYELYYGLFRDLIVSKPWIQGVNLDVEETVSIDDIKKLINNIRGDFGVNFTISMAPVSSAMEEDIPGMGGFVYKDLFKSPEGSNIDWFNCQCYESFSLETYKKIIDNGYPEDKITMGMMSGQFSDDSFVKVVHDIKSSYPNVAGFYDWEYLDAPPNKDNPSEWAKLVKNA
jgi:alkaline phosphatase D